MNITIAVLVVWVLAITWILRIARMGAQHRELGDVVARRRFRL